MAPQGRPPMPLAQGPFHVAPSQNTMQPQVQQVVGLSSVATGMAVVASNGEQSISGQQQAFLQQHQNLTFGPAATQHPPGCAWKKAASDRQAESEGQAKESLALALFQKELQTLYCRIMLAAG